MINPDQQEPEFQWVEDMIVSLAEFGFNLVCVVVTILWQFILAIVGWINHNDA